MGILNQTAGTRIQRQQAHMGTSTVPRTARNARSNILRQLTISNIINLKRRGAGGGMGLFELLFGGGIFGGIPGIPGGPGDDDDGGPGGGGGGDDDGGGGGPGGPQNPGGQLGPTPGEWDGWSNIVTPGGIPQAPI